MTKKANAPTHSEIEAARKEGILDADRESATTQDIDAPAFNPSEDGQRFINVKTNDLENLSSLGLEALEGAIDPKKDDALSEEAIAGLLILERNGPNRTDFVRLLMKRLKIKDIRKELPQAGGPDYTNDVSAVSAL